MGLKVNVTKNQKSEILPKYFMFPVQIVATFELEVQTDLKNFNILHKKLFWWWLGQYIPSYVKDIKDNVVANPHPKEWRMTWPDAIKKCGCPICHLPVFCLSSHTGSPRENIEMEDFHITRLPEKQSVRPLVRAKDKRLTF